MARKLVEIEGAQARSAKVSRESLYRALSRNGNPALSTIIGVLRACRAMLAAKAA